MWDLRIQVNPTYVPVFGRAVLKEIYFELNPVNERLEEFGVPPESQLCLYFYVENAGVTQEESRRAVTLLKEHLPPTFQPTSEWVRCSHASAYSGLYRVPLNLPRCNFADHAVDLLQRVVKAWAIDWRSPILQVTQSTIVKVRTTWVGFGQYLEMKHSREI
ncbi:MAG: hypothetical protein KW802_01535 [Candidatus Doudnabacteria bacterium]|nr:hypothetical protein [Candidatus Doudnabacteria bacterium]